MGIFCRENIWRLGEFLVRGEEEREHKRERERGKEKEDEGKEGGTLFLFSFFF